MIDYKDMQIFTSKIYTFIITTVISCCIVFFIFCFLYLSIGFAEYRITQNDNTYIGTYYMTYSGLIRVRDKDGNYTILHPTNGPIHITGK